MERNTECTLGLEQTWDCMEN